MKCRYNGCTFEGTPEEVEEHVDYCKSIGDPEHEEEQRR